MPAPMPGNSTLYSLIQYPTLNKNLELDYVIQAITRSLQCVTIAVSKHPSNNAPSNIYFLFLACGSHIIMVLNSLSQK